MIQSDEKSDVAICTSDLISASLRYSVKEYMGKSVKEVVGYIEGEPEVSKETVDDEFLPMIDAAGKEAVSINDGKRIYDIKFKARIPNSDKKAEIIINIEAQKDYYPGYTLEKRGIYYLSRLISSQYRTEFMKSNFDKMKKVYSIWICYNCPADQANTITSYSFRPENISGKAKDYPEKYDMMTLVMVCMGKPNSGEGLLKLFDVLMNKVLSNDGDKRNEAMTEMKEEFEITTLNEREVESMCNWSGIFYDRGICDGMDKGKIMNALNVMKNLLKKGFAESEALEIAEIDKETYEKYKNEIL